MGSLEVSFNFDLLLGQVKVVCYGEYNGARESFSDGETKAVAGSIQYVSEF